MNPLLSYPSKFHVWIDACFDVTKPLFRSLGPYTVTPLTPFPQSHRLLIHLLIIQIPTNPSNPNGNIQDINLVGLDLGANGAYMTARSVLVSPFMFTTTVGCVAGANVSCVDKTSVVRKGLNE